MALFHSPRIVTDGLVLCLDAGNRKSYPGSGTTWTDLSGRGNNGTLVNGVGYDSGNLGSLVFDGVNDNVNLGNILNIGTGPFSIETVAKASSTTNNFAKVASKGQYLQGGWSLYFGKNLETYTISFQYGNSSTGLLSLPEVVVNIETWYHILITRDSSNLLSFYINSSNISSKNETFNFTTSFNYVLGANVQNGEFFRGNMALYRHYSRALSASEIQQNFNAIRGRFGI